MFRTKTFTKIRNRFPDLEGLLAISVFILMIPIFLVVSFVFELFTYKERKLFREGYNEFLKNHEGQEFFCNTNRKSSVLIIERELLSEVDNSIHIIKLVGKKPETDLDERYISHALNNIKNVGFPNIMKIVSGVLIDYSLHSKFYHAMSHKKNHDFKQILEEGLSNLRSSRATKT